MNRFVSTSCLATMGGVLLSSLLGCEPTKPIQSYSIPKPDVVYETNHVDPGAPEDASGNPLPLDDRMLGAFVPHAQTAWFVKLSGAKDAIAPHAEAFEAFVKSFQFSADPNAEPTWQAPAGWKQTAGPAPRFATLTIADTSPPLEVTVSSLPLNDGDVSAYVLLNINRWRKQMSLRPIAQQRLAKDSKTLKVAGGNAVYVDMLGKLQAAGMPGASPMAGHPPIANNSAVPSSGQRPSPTAGNSPAADQAKGIKFETPAGWKTASKDAFSQVALEAGTGAETVRITFSALAAAASDLTSNVNRWRGQAGLPPVDEAALMANVAKMEIGGAPGSYVELIGPREAILGAIVVHGDQAWFLKLRGPAAAAQAQQTKFRELLKSIRFE